MNWGKGIIITFILFAGLVTSMVVISMNQEVGLVAPDYYKQEIAYQQQINRINNYKTLNEKPVINLDRSNHQVLLKFPKLMGELVQNGKIELFRPSKSGIDQIYRIKLDENQEQRIDVSRFLKGRWKIKLSWEINSQGYYNELAINL